MNCCDNFFAIVLSYLKYVVSVQWYFYVVGWILPVLVMIPYIVIHMEEKNNKKCWMETMGSMEWFQYPLPLLCLIVS